MQHPDTPHLPPVYLDDQGRYVVRSKEHTRTILAEADYQVTLEAPLNPADWPLVRVYDKVLAPRDHVLLVMRAAISGKTPEQIEADLSLAFKPTFICDAVVPAGGYITIGVLTNAGGDVVRVYLAHKQLRLANERPIE